ncbi:MAG: putative short-chain type dehydrogenase/reductase [Mycobacterium sp.]|nr:putative short-chain type dehydrogenase/reductase [Mycobacterium sp.]MCW2744217.1 putative short-chain type dehydrogenase/reductase [Mycobacterium sp.]
MANISFENRVAIVTGAGGGLGRTYALELAARGAKVVVNDLGGARDGSGGSATAAERVVEEIKAAGGEAVANADSVATPEGGQNIVQTALDAFGTVDIVINNAGILRDKSFAKMEVSDIELVLDVHLKGAFYVSQPAFKVMKEKGYGRFVHTSSNSGLFGNFGQANYGAAKLGIAGLSHVLAIEGAKNNIKSNCIAPVARTRMTEELMGDFNKFLDPELVTPMVVFLASEACDLTHEIYSAAAGRYARVFLGLNNGWFAGAGNAPSAEDIVDHLDQIRDTSEFIIPANSGDELGQLFSLMSGS